MISPSFYGLHTDFSNERHTHYWLEGGRGSTKSSWAAIEIILGLMKHKEANAIILRKVGDTIRDSAYEQYIWATEMLGVGHLWHSSVAPMRLIFKPTGQKIMFRGADKPEKIKSTKFSRGYAKYIHYEEASEFGNMEDIRNINQSLVRGGANTQVMYSYNPPASQNNWINKEIDQQRLRDDTYVHHSDYLSVPKEWLGENFIRDAEHLKRMNPTKYAHEYLGERTGTGAEVFTNITQRVMPDSEVNTFDKIYRGIDFGFAADPFHYTQCYYDSARKRLFIYAEIHKVGMTNSQIVEAVKKLNPDNDFIIADSAEPRTINELNGAGLRIAKAKKGPGSVEHGVKLLQDMNEIIIDPVRCPNTTREFTGYELERDHHGNLKGNYPDKDNHSIDAVRYAMEQTRSKWLI
jgi:PBSX family phage terminase large subunit